MKKRVAHVGLLFAMLVVVGAVAVGCGKSPDDSNKDVAATSTPVPMETPDAAFTEVPIVEEVKGQEDVAATLTPVPTKAPVAERVEAQEEEELYQITNTAETILKIDEFSPYTRVEEIKMQRIAVPVNRPYFVGRKNYEENVNFFENNRGEGDGYLYLGLPMYLPDYCPKETVYVKVDDEEVAEIKGNDLVGLKQGVFRLFCYDKNKNLLMEKKMVCSTYNDSREDIGSLMSIKATKFDDMKAHWNMSSIEYWRDNVHTMLDMTYMLQARNFVYDVENEPKLGLIENCMPEDGWSWTAPATTIFDMNAGVCIQVAQLACYMLAGDYEDWGVVLVEGKQGHIFNWFFEDGYYYIFDFTDVIGDNSGNSNGERKFRDYSDKVKKFQTIDEIKEYIVNEKVNIKDNYLVYMYSCLGHDYIACNLNTGMSDSHGVTEGKYDKITIGYQDVVKRELVVLYQNENSSDIEWITRDANQLSDLIQHGVYFDNDIYQYRYKYKK